MIVYFSLNPFFEELALKKSKDPILNYYISKTRTNSESKLNFSESQFNFLQSRVAFFTRQGALPPTTPGAAISGSQRSKS